ncbi:hypothetical protein [Chlorogloeopsis sp. ULAP02]|uniref:hypothetical protein n=1 Tax=Chlorogloeopsis sp. ULAP02 TaxID=3107926 RepID=UPI003136C7DD
MNNSQLPHSTIVVLLSVTTVLTTTLANQAALSALNVLTELNVEMRQTQTDMTNPAILIIAQQSDFASFFEEGRLRSENRLQFNRPSNPAISIDPTGKSWQLVVFREGNCSFWMPPGVISHETLILNTQADKLSFRTLSSSSNQGRYLAAYASNLTKAQRNSPELIFNAIKEKITSANQFSLKQENPVKSSQYNGRDFLFENKNQAIALRTYLIEGRIYALGVQYPKANAPTRAVNAFLDSFELLKS